MNETGPVHKCPVHGCTIQVDDRFLMCRPHWRLVPADLAAAVYRAYHRKDTNALRLAQNDAVQAVNKRAA